MPFRRLSTFLPFFTSTTIRTSADDSSLTSAISSNTLSFMRFTRLSTSLDLLPVEVNGISVNTIFFFPLSPSSITYFPLTRSLPSPFSYIPAISSAFEIIPPVGKSGPGIYFISFSVLSSGLSRRAIAPFIISPGL